MKPRKKTKLCLQCNGINPISASHCAYCGAILGVEEPEKTELPISSQGTQDLFAPMSSFTQTEPQQPAPYHSSLTSHGFVQDRQPAISEEGLEKPLYSVFDQPQCEQMGGLEDELMRSPKVASVAQKSAPDKSASGFFAKCTALFSGSQNQEREGETNELTNTLAAGALATGTTLIFLSLVTFIFSQDGKVVVSWSEQTAAWVMLASIAMIGFGWKMTSSRQSR